MMELKIDTSALSKAAQDVAGLPGVFKRAEASALKSTGFMIRKAMRDYIEANGQGSWPELHPVSRFYSKKYMMGTSQWKKSRRSQGAMHWLGKFSRYRVTDTEAVVGFGKSHGARASKAERGAAATISPFLLSVVRRAEHGERTGVTDSMRRFFGATRMGNHHSQMAGQTFFPIKKSTKYITTPKRPIFDPVLARVEGGITDHYEDKFWRAVTRYRDGVKNKI